MNSEGNGDNIIDFSSANFDELLYKTRNHLETLKRIWTSELVDSPDQGGVIDHGSMKRAGLLASVNKNSENIHINNNMNNSTKFLSKKNT